MLETYLVLNFEKDLAMFEANQKVTLEKVDNLLSCRAAQTFSTPGIIKRNLTLVTSKIYCLEIDGWANCPRAFVQVIDSQTNQRLIEGYRYLSTDQNNSKLKINFQTNAKSINLAVFFGGSSVPRLTDQFWLRSIAITNRDCLDQPSAPHRQIVDLSRASAQVNWPMPVLKQATNLNGDLVFFSQKEAQLALTKEPHRFIEINQEYFLYFDPDGYVRYLKK